MKLRCALIAGAFVSGVALAAEPLPKADGAKGQTIATQVCAACHGQDGNSVAPVNPKLAAQIPDYLAKQLANFKPAAAGKSAERVSAVMAGFAAGLSSDDMRNVAAYYSAQTLKPEKARSKDTIELGQKIYRAGIAEKGVAACAACHGPRGEGVPAQYPALGGQFADYIDAQLKAFRSGERANDPNKTMRMTAAKMTDAEINAVADYIAGLR
ncbi:MAG TPA: c-type cytochrome [Burkholderiales bacterium]|nr:c-type cytochrome [Burkholderiales bacterium]